MAQFLKEYDLNSALSKIFEDAKSELIIISPFIKLHPRFKDILKDKIDQDSLKIIIVFGKNKDKLFNSFNKDDFNFLKEFPNIEIKYEERLHAKYYANDSAALLSSMNLYDYSQDNNIEFGILTQVTSLSELTSSILGDSIDKDAFKYFENVIKKSNCLFKKRPIYKDKFLGLSKTYLHSETEIDQLSPLLELKKPSKNITPTAQSEVNEKVGYCIRTGKEISFNPSVPFSDTAFKFWNRYKDVDYQEKYCHYSGEKSNGQTSFAKPILKKNWKNAKELISIIK